MKRLLISSLLSLALCPSAAHASPGELNVKGWHQPDWWKCDDTPGFVKLFYWRQDHMDRSYCVSPSTFIRTAGGGRVMHQERSIWTTSPELSPALAMIIKNPAVKGDKRGMIGWMEVNCQTMEYRYNQFMNVMTTRPSMSSKWRQFSYQPDASFWRGSHGWSEWEPIVRQEPVQDWICRQVDV